jgi:hypothetical protein
VQASQLELLPQEFLILWFVHAASLAPRGVAGSVAGSLLATRVSYLVESSDMPLVAAMAVLVGQAAHVLQILQAAAC